MKNKLIIFFVFLGLKGSACITYDTLNVSICPGDSFLFNGIYQKTAGTYQDTLVNAALCDSFLTLNLSLYPAPTMGVIYDSFCDTRSYDFNGRLLYTAGLYYDTVKNANNCDSIVELWLSYKTSVPITNLYDTVCQGDSVYFNNRYWVILGTQTIRDTFASANGCDSIVWLNMRSWTNPTRFLGNVFGCKNKPYVYRDSSFTTNGFKQVRVSGVAAHGCDSIYWLNLTMRDTSPTTFIQVIRCSDNPFFFNGNTLTATGIYYDTLANRNGCDSVIELDYTYNLVKTTVVDTYFCENYPYFFNDQYLTSSGRYLDTLQTVNGCDSFIILKLTKRFTSRYTFYRKFCANHPVFFNNRYIDTPGIFLDTLVNSQNCDSFLTMVLARDTIAQTVVNQTICSNDSIYFGGAYLSDSGTYYTTLTTQGGCDSMITLNLRLFPSRTVILAKDTTNIIRTDSTYLAYKWYFNDYYQLNGNKYFLTANNIGNYHVVILDSNHCSFKSNTINNSPSSGVNAAAIHNILIYPNPASDKLYIDNLAILGETGKIKLIAIDGKEVFSKSFYRTTLQHQFDISTLPQGLYLLKIEGEKYAIERKIVVNK